MPALTPSKRKLSLLTSWFSARPSRTARRAGGPARSQLSFESLEDRTVPATWTSASAPAGLGVMMLLPDGTVMAENSFNNKGWQKLTPDSGGSYENGNWTTLANMSTDRLYFGSNVMTDGRVFVLGGEYSASGSWTRTGEIYNPVTNRWSAIPSFPQSQFGDDPTILLPDGTILAGYLSGPQTYIFDPTLGTNGQWTQTGDKLLGDASDEETWVMLPDGSILTYNIFATVDGGNPSAQRYIPSTGTWVDAGTPPNNLSSGAVGYEFGPASLLADGRVFMVGATGETAIYNPTTNAWVQGPVTPGGYGSDDAPGAVLPNGHVIFTGDQPLFGTGAHMFEYDPTANTITDITSSLPSTLQSELGSSPAYVGRMLVLPTGQVMMVADSGSTAWFYTPDGGPDDSERPTVSSVVHNSGQTFTLTGTQLTGMSAGASYGDDAEMDTNYPIIQLTGSAGNVIYAKSHDWTPGVQTGSAVVTTKFDVPLGLPTDNYSLRVIASGIASQPFAFDTRTSAVTNVTSTPSTGTYGLGATIQVNVTFNNAVTVTGTPKLALNSNATAVATYTGGSGTNTLTFTYTVGAGDDTPDLDYTSTSALALNGGTIKNALTATNATVTLPAPQAAGSLGFNSSVAIHTGPTVTNVTSTTADGSYGAGTVIAIQMTFDKAVIVTGQPQLALNSGGVATYTGGTGTNTLTFTYTVLSGHSSTDLDYLSANSLALNGGTMKDAGGNAAGLSLPATGGAGSLGFNKNIVIDAIPLTVTAVTSSSPNGFYGIGTTINIQINFIKPAFVTGAPTLALNTTGGVAAVATYTGGSGTKTLSFTYTVTAGQSSDDLDEASATALNLNGGTVLDAIGVAGNVTLPAPQAVGSLGANKSLIIDAVAPVALSVTSPVADATYGVGATIPINVAFSKTLFVTGTPVLALNSGGVATYTSGTGTNLLTFTYVVGAGEIAKDLDYASTAAISLNGGTIQDAASNPATLALPKPGASGSLGFNKNIQIKTPAATLVTGVTSSTADGTYGAGATVSIQVSFGATVTVTGVPTLALNTGGTATYTSGSGTSTLTFTYTVASGETTPDLDYASSIALALNGGTIKDAANTPAKLTLPTPGAAGSLGANKNIAIDAVPLTVTGVTSSSANGIYGAGATISITVTFNKLTTVTGAPQLALNTTGGAAGVATYSGGSGTSILTFTYTVTAGQTSPDLDYASVSALTLNGGTIKDAAGNAATLTLPAPGSAGSLGANKNIAIDGVVPVVSNVTSPMADGTYGVGAGVTIQVLFSKSVIVTGSPTLSLNSGGTATYSGGSGTSTLTFTYTVVAGQNAADLDYTSATALTLNGGTINDAGNNSAATLTLAAPGAAGSLGANKNIVISTPVATKVTNVTSSTPNGTYGVGAGVSIQVSFGATVTVTGSPKLSLNSGGTATYSGGSGTSTLTFTYTVAAGNSAADLDYTSATALTLNGGTITDSNSNPAVLTLPAPGAAGSLGANKNIVISAVGPVVQHYYVLAGSKKFDLIGSARTNLPWLISGIQVVFNEPITSGNASSLSGLKGSSFTGLGTNTLSWKVETLTSANYSTLLQGSGTAALKDAAGIALGNGAGFSQAFKVLIGDVNDDGVRDAADVAAVTAGVNQPYNFFFDLNGDGLVNSKDVTIAKAGKP